MAIKAILVASISNGYGISNTNIYQPIYIDLVDICQEYDDNYIDWIFANKKKTDLINYRHIWHITFTSNDHKFDLYYYRHGNQILVDWDPIIYSKDVPAHIAVNAAIQAKIASLQAEGYVANPDMSAEPCDIFLDLEYHVLQ